MRAEWWKFPRVSPICKEGPEEQTIIREDCTVDPPRVISSVTREVTRRDREAWEALQLSLRDES
jgi:hypothetical protein